MATPRVYVETTIPSSYHDARTDPESVARREVTRRWWADAADRYELLTAPAVYKELMRGVPERAAERLALLAGLPVLDVVPDIAGIVAAYIEHKLMPADPEGDALHLAVASYYRCDYLLTWNCQHLANANKFGHVRRVNAVLGLFVPTLVTPRQLLGASDGTVPS